MAKNQQSRASRGYSTRNGTPAPHRLRLPRMQLLLSGTRSTCVPHPQRSPVCSLPRWWGFESVSCVGVNLCIDRFAERLHGCLKSVHIVGRDAAIQPSEILQHLGVNPLQCRPAPSAAIHHWKLRQGIPSLAENGALGKYLENHPLPPRIRFVKLNIAPK